MSPEKEKELPGLQCVEYDGEEEYRLSWDENPLLPRIVDFTRELSASITAVGSSRNDNAVDGFLPTVTEKIEEISWTGVLTRLPPARSK